MTIFFRLLGSACYVLAVITSSSARDDDEVAAFAIADSRARYESLRDDYIQQGCPEVLGEFPSVNSTLSSTSTTTTTTTTTSALERLFETETSSSAALHEEQNGVDDEDEHMARAVLCNCGLIFDMAAAAVFRDEQDLTVATATVSGNGSSKGKGKSKSNNDETAFQVSQQDEESSITKLDSWVMARKANTQASCIGNRAAGYPCKYVDLVAHFPLTDFSTTNTNQFPRAANDIWGWTSNNREFLVWGVREGHYFFEVKNENLELLGYMPATDGRTALQHDMKILGNYCYLGAEALDHGVQIFDMRRLLSINPNRDCISPNYCQQLSPNRLYTGTSAYRVKNSHNIVTNPDNLNYVYVVGGGNGCGGGLHVVDVSNPNRPQFVTCFGDAGYVHDAQCVYYKGPDAAFYNKELCFCFNGKKTWIVDVTNKGNMKILSTSNYNRAGYTHQGWLSSDHSYLVFGDERDEGFFGKTRTLVQNIENLRNPGPVREFLGPTGAVDHNQYIIKATAPGQDYDPIKHSHTDLIYQANYEAGLSILQVLDYENAELKEIAFFDTYPLADSRHFLGAWSTYPYFASGLTAISSIEEGIFLVRPNLEPALLEPEGKVNPVPTPTDPPTEMPTRDCSDGVLKFQGKKRKNCRWVANTRRKNRRAIKRRCSRPYEGGNVFDVCRKVCGQVNLGPCKNVYSYKNTASKSLLSLPINLNKDNIFDHT